MDFYTPLLSKRTTGSTGISIGSHLALESFFFNKLKIYDTERKFTKLKVEDYDIHIWNLFTIVRNILNACEEKDKSLIFQDPTFPQLIIDEVGNISSLYADTTCKPYLFYPDYTKVMKDWNKDKQPILTNPMKETINIANLLASLKKKKLIQEDNVPLANNKRDHKLPELGLKGKRVIITTHLAVDLFNPCVTALLESHTGKLKKENEYNSKYHVIGKQDLSKLPWLQELYYLLGDYHLVVGVKNIIMRKKILEVAERFNWTPTTSKVKALVNLGTSEINLWLRKFKALY